MLYDKHRLKPMVKQPKPFPWLLIIDIIILGSIATFAGYTFWKFILAIP